MAIVEVSWEYRSGRYLKRDATSRAWRVALTVVFSRRQVAAKWDVVSGGIVRERNRLMRGVVTGPPDQRVCEGDGKVSW